MQQCVMCVVRMQKRRTLFGNAVRIHAYVTDEVVLPFCLPLMMSSARARMGVSFISCGEVSIISFDNALFCFALAFKLQNSLHDFGCNKLARCFVLHAQSCTRVRVCFSWACRLCLLWRIYVICMSVVCSCFIVVGVVFCIAVFACHCEWCGLWCTRSPLSSFLVVEQLGFARVDVVFGQFWFCHCVGMLQLWCFNLGGMGVWHASTWKSLLFGKCYFWKFL